ncbi:MAG: thiamine-phosphate kinase, partial [Isosphaeraceae bacterium]
MRPDLSDQKSQRDVGPQEPIVTGEFGLIDWVRSRTRPGAQTALGIGDDCALLRVSPGAEVLATTDMLIEGRHFDFDDATPEQIGFKALAVNLSDIAAMAGIPRFALIALALPRGRAVELAQRVFAGLKPLAERFGVDLVGGDTNAWDGPLVISVTLLGETTAQGAVRRSGAKPGDLIVVTGPLGGSLLGRHLRPEPRVEEALALHKIAKLHAMIDLSDGLASDLAHILDESGSPGATLNADAIPIHADAETLASRDGRTPLDHALNDGEDFELCFTIHPDDAGLLIDQRPAHLTLSLIGTIDETPGLRLRVSGEVVPLAAQGFDHLKPDHS